MRYILAVLIMSYGCASYGVHEQNLETQRKRMLAYDKSSRRRQQHIRSSNAQDRPRVSSHRKPKRYIQ